MLIEITKIGWDLGWNLYERSFATMAELRRDMADGIHRSIRIRIHHVSGEINECENLPLNLFPLAIAFCLWGLITKGLPPSAAADVDGGRQLSRLLKFHGSLAYCSMASTSLTVKTSTWWSNDQLPPLESLYAILRASIRWTNAAGEPGRFNTNGDWAVMVQEAHRINLRPGDRQSMELMPQETPQAVPFFNVKD
ncbi:hypothetical protein ACH5RR_037548 [Cinchona calisaya]|uniref:Uncharacterized protein n=1 Tax=Cinchona calisaya TaxID=153742 RepID=A0ABD2Y6I3_9GENT